MNFTKMTLNINGADRTFICDPETDTLASVLRRLGLTGTKVGCGVGVCGSCSVILNGKVIRSCTKKIKSVDQYSEVLTIEGIGDPRHLHPLQVAFMHYGAVQCGFCIPGFIVSAYQLLQENPDPTRDEVRAWFKKTRNICRCTGYKQIIDAVLAAAKVMRGECDIEDIKLPVTDGDYYSKSLPRPSALAKVCGVADYGDDIELKMPSGTLHVALATPAVTNHAKILKVNTEEAEKMPGVYKVLIGKDFHQKGLTNRNDMFLILPWTICPEESTHPLIAEDKIFNWGDAIAMVAADTKEHAVAAAAKVTMDYEELPAVMNYLDAVKPGAVRVHEEHDNYVTKFPMIKGAGVDTGKIIDECEYVVEGSFYAQRQPHMSIEGDTIQAYWDEDGKLCVHCKSQGTGLNLGDVAAATGLPMEKLRMVCNPTGGGFGWPIAGGTFAMAAMACIAFDDRPVALSMTYQQYMNISGKRSPAYSNARLGCDKDGIIQGVEFDQGLDHGQWDVLCDDVVAPNARFSFFPYNVPNCRGLSRAATTNHAFGTAYRAYGAVQCYTMAESLMDMMAEKIGISPFEIRWRNICRPGGSLVTGAELPVHPLEDMMKTMKPLYDEAVERAKKEDTPEVRRGVGFVCGGYKVTNGAAEVCDVALELREDGKFVKYDTWQDLGQGGDIGSLQVTLKALQPLGVTVDDVVLIQNDTKYCPEHGLSAASRSHYINGNATKDAADKLIAAMTKEDGTFRTYQEMVDEGIPTKYFGQYSNSQNDEVVDSDPANGQGATSPEYTHTMFLAEVAVETATGKTTVLSMTCVDDMGVIGDVNALEGQAFGGMSHGIGFALKERYEDPAKDTDVLRAGAPDAMDIPADFKVIHLNTPRASNVWGSSGCSEGYQSSPHMAVINGIKDACGVRIYELPATPEKVKAGIDALARGEEILPPEKFYLGSDFEEEMAFFKAQMEAE